jgi:hypothetical protein
LWSHAPGPSCLPLCPVASHRPCGVATARSMRASTRRPWTFQWPLIGRVSLQPELPTQQPPDDHRRVAQVQDRSVREGERHSRVVLQPDNRQGRHASLPHERRGRVGGRERLGLQVRDVGPRRGGRDGRRVAAGLGRRGRRGFGRRRHGRLRGRIPAPVWIVWRLTTRTVSATIPSTAPRRPSGRRRRSPGEHRDSFPTTP